MGVYECTTCRDIDRHAAAPESCGLCGGRMERICLDDGSIGAQVNCIDPGTASRKLISVREILGATALSAALALTMHLVASDTSLADCVAVASFDTCAYALR